MKKRIVLIAVGVLLLSLGFSRSSDPVEVLPPPKARSRTATFQYLGAGSCAASACHNNGAEPGTPGSEYTTWAAQPRAGQRHDPHANAYNVLLERQSQSISHLLRRKKPAHQDSLCLNCHVTPDHDLAHAKGLVPENFVTDGVSCESCHGPAERWVTEHYRPAWREKSSAQKAELGMKDTRSIVGRARVCASCHVGSLPLEEGGIGQDVTHDLYAAGHPPLVFEFSAYHASLLHHWQDEKDRDPRFGGTPDFETRAWLVGQLTSAEASLDLLIQRAGDRNRPWPELAEMDCFACHHDLKGTAERTDLRLGAGKHGADKKSSRKPGSIPFRTWYYLMLPRAAEQVGADPGEVTQSLAKLEKEMETIFSDRLKVMTLARAMRENVKSSLARADKLESLDLKRLYTQVRATDVPKAGTSWDHAAQAFLAIAAMENTWNDLNLSPTHGNLPTTIEAIREELRFPNGFLSPANFSPTLVRKKFERLR